MSVASPAAPGARLVDARAARNCSPCVPVRSTATHGDDGQRDRGGGADRDQAPRRPWARASRRLDARSQGRRRLDLGSGALDECDRPLLLGEQVGELRRLGDLCLERGTALRRKRTVRERRQLDDLGATGFVLSSASHRHCTGNRNSECVPAATRAREIPAGPIQRALTPRRTPFGGNYSRLDPTSCHSSSSRLSSISRIGSA